MFGSIKNWMGPYQPTPKKVTRAIKYPGLGVRSVNPVGDFLDWGWCLGHMGRLTPKVWQQVRRFEKVTVKKTQKEGKEIVLSKNPFKVGLYFFKFGGCRYVDD